MRQNEQIYGSYEDFSCKVTEILFLTVFLFNQLFLSQKLIDLAVILAQAIMTCINIQICTIRGALKSLEVALFLRMGGFLQSMDIQRSHDPKYTFLHTLMFVAYSERTSLY